MFKDCNKNIEYIKKQLSNSVDIAEKTFYVKNTQLAIIYLKSLTNPKLISEIIMSQLLSINFAKTPQTQQNAQKSAKSKIGTKGSKNTQTNSKTSTKTANLKSALSLDKVAEQLIKSADLEVMKDEPDADKQILSSILLGKAIIFLNGECGAVVVDVEDVQSRQPTEPPTSAVIYGPREGFIESAKQNLSMLRKRLPTENLVVKDFKIGRYTKTKVFVTYIKGIASLRVVKEICKKLEKIDIDGIVDSHYILAFLQKNSNNFFKQAGVAEKPDIVTAKLLEGRVALIIDNSPIVLTVPFLIFEDLQNSNDYYSNPIYISFIRIIRLLGVLIACVVPGTYLALRLYHYKVLPLRFLITIANSTEGLPFTPFIELLFILILFQILYEVSLRLPRYLGLATSIVGALILGDTGVNAGLISPPGVIIIAMSIISIYTVPDQASQLTILRVVFLILGGTIGILGIVGYMIYLINENAQNEKYGVPYLAPYAPRIKSDLKDGVFMKSISDMKTRPKSLENQNLIRINNSRKKQNKKIEITNLAKLNNSEKNLNSKPKISKNKKNKPQNKL